MRYRGVLITIVGVALLAIASAVLTVRMAARAIDTTATAQAAEAPDIARMYIAQYGSLAAAAPAIVRHVTRPGLHVALRDAKTGITYGDLGAARHRHAPGRDLDRSGPPGEQAPPGGPHAPDRVGLLVAMLAGETALRTPVPGGELMIFPAPESILGVLRSVAAALTIVFLFGITSLWLYARGVRREALRPLRETTLSLQRLAQRDFSPRTILSGEGTAYDELARAYNAAVEAVSSAFAERRTAEIEMQRFIADAGHELRTPLTIVMGYLDIIDGGGLADPKIAGRVVAGMRTESMRMRKLIEKLIVLAWMDTPSDVEQRTDIDVVSLVARVIESLEPLATGPIDVSGVSFAHVYANEDDLAEALTNIIENALKYAPLSSVRVTVARAVDRVRIAVADRGPGMSTDEVRNAFERFYRGERRGEVAGSGLGLAIAKRAIERARGTIRLDSIPGVGTTFTIELPEIPLAVGERTPHVVHT